MNENSVWPRTTDHGDKNNFELCIDSCNQQGLVSACQYHLLTKSCMSISENARKPENSQEALNSLYVCFIFHV